MSPADPAPQPRAPADLPPSRAVDDVPARMQRLHPKIIDLSLDRVHRLLAALGHPERQLPPVIHVAGTNGKGSTIAFMRAMLEAAGLAVHAYTSPHLIRFNERVRVAGRLIQDADLIRLLDECEAANGATPITYFEITTVAALLAFARTPADVVLLETGMGGRLDATNVIDRPAATVITRISYDHMQFLGETLEQIAAEKAGIFKPDVPAVVAPQVIGDGAGPDAAHAILRVFRQRAAAVDAPVHAHGEGWSVARTDAGFRFDGFGRTLDLPPPALIGAFQIANAGTAIAGLEAAGFTLDAAALADGLRAVQWPGRLQELTRGPLVDLLPDGWQLWLDGAHNDSAAEAVAAEMARWTAGDPRPIHLVFGLLATKRPDHVLAPVLARCASVTAVAVPGDVPGLPAEEAAAAARAHGFAGAVAAGSLRDAIDSLTALAPGPARVLIYGSLYLAGAVLAENG